jgi:hypothetical protein
LQPSWLRANAYDQAKPQMVRKIVAHVTKEQLSDELIAWIEKLARIIRHEPL